MSREIVVLGFDPGLATTGYGIVRALSQGWEVVTGGVLTTEQGMPRAERLKKLYEEACALIRTYTPDGVAIEEIYLAKNARTAMITAETRGVLLLATDGLPVRGYTPLEVKKRITGYGKATKEQVQAMVKRLLRLRELPRPDDAADGLAIALCYLIDLRGIREKDHVYL
jgi:crossover junction endodeoxyribonuclease RuvC